MKRRPKRDDEPASGIRYTVSIYMPVYNQQELVVRALDSVPRIPEVDIIVCDDSDDGLTYPVLEKYKDEHPDLKITLITNNGNVGAGYSINRCLDLCTGDYVYGLDNDDYLYTDVFIHALKELDGSDMVYVSIRSNDGHVWWVTPETKMSLVAGFTRFIKRSFLGDIRRPTDVWYSDGVINNVLQALPHTEKFTDLVPYHYNFPREGSMFWRATHGDTSVR